MNDPENKVTALAQAQQNKNQRDASEQKRWWQSTATLVIGAAGVLFTAMLILNNSVLGRFDSLDRNISDTRSEVGEVREDVMEIQREVGDLHKEVGYIKGRLDGEKEQTVFPAEN